MVILFDFFDCITLIAIAGPYLGKFLLQFGLVADKEDKSRSAEA